MNVKATTIDHHRADISVRELFSCSEQQAEKIYEMLKEDSRISGSVLINTCNRTELYLSLEEDPKEGRGKNTSSEFGKETVDPFEILCGALEIDPDVYRDYQVTMENEDALRHLCLLTAGAQSQLWGDSQIITQVGEAADHARKINASDSVLNTMFRLGITAGKEIRTNVDLYINDASTAGRAAERILMEPEVESVLVIGNGTIGRLVAENLAASGVNTFMTLRKYNNGQALVPDKVQAVPYADRYIVMEKCEGVVSATASPHVVITREGLEEMESPPSILIDMAVPRDVEEGVNEIHGVQCYNIDDISRGRHIQLKDDQMSRLDKYIEDQIREFHRWEASREKIDGRIRRLTAEDRDISERRHFPLFIDTLDQKVVVIGGGNIAERRVMTMSEFGFDITVVSGDLTDTLKRMEEGKAIKWVPGKFQTGGEQPGGIEALMDSAWLVLACTNDRNVNRAVGEYCRGINKLVNICDARNESTFWFPAVALNEELTVGVVGKGNDHMNVKKAAAALREVVENKSYK